MSLYSGPQFGPIPGHSGDDNTIYTTCLAFLLVPVQLWNLVLEAEPDIKL